MRRQQVNREDRGATAITIAISMLVLMGFTAITIDGGLAYGDRRVLASAADTGALAALQFARPSLIGPGPCLNIGGGLANEAACRGAEEAIEVVNGTLPGRFDIDDDWATCNDPNRPEEFKANVSPLSRCISFTENFSKSRVKMPDTDLPTTFGRLIGFNSIATGANAEAEILSGAVASVQPWALGPTGGLKNQVCLMANPSSNLDVEPCNGPTQGNFGKLDLALYGPEITGTPTICGNAMTQTKMAINIVVGSDHFLEKAGDPPVTIVNDFASCDIISLRINEVKTQPGNSEGGIYQGYFSGISTPLREGRLMCKTGSGDEDPKAGLLSIFCEPVGDSFPQFLDSTALWEYITTYADDNISDCSKSLVLTRQLMEKCIETWRMSSHGAESLFTGEIVKSPRFSAVPELTVDPSFGSGDYLIKDFRPIYVSTIYLKCSANTCDIVHSPGETGDDICPDLLTKTVNTCGVLSTGNKKIVAITSYLLTLDMLSTDLRANFPAVAGTVLFNLSH